MAAVVAAAVDNKVLVVVEVVLDTALGKMVDKVLYQGRHLVDNTLVAAPMT
jgi:translation initiation factor IF-2